MKQSIVGLWNLIANHEFPMMVGSLIMIGLLLFLFSRHSHGLIQDFSRCHHKYVITSKNVLHHSVHRRPIHERFLVTNYETKKLSTSISDPIIEKQNGFYLRSLLMMSILTTFYCGEVHSAVADPDVINVAVETVSNTLNTIIIPETIKQPVLTIDSRYFLAGGICACFSHAISVPFDVVKTRLQTSTSTTEFTDKNIIAVAKTIAAQDGIGMLFKGIGPTCIGYTIQGSMKYGWYEALKPVVASFLTTSGYFDTITQSSDTSTITTKLLTFMLAGGVAEAIGSSFLSPFEAARIRLVVNPTFATGVVTCIQKIIKEEKMDSLYRGLPSILAKQLPYTIVQLSSYEVLTSSFYNYLELLHIDDNTVDSYRYGISAICALIAAVLSSLASQPGDTMLSAVNQNSRIALSEGKPYVGTIAIMKATVKEQGLSGLFKGTVARLYHVSVIVVAQLLVYDFVKELSGIPVTGSH